MTPNEQTASPIVIRSNRLAIEIAPPGAVYHRTRFDWTGFITQVTLDGKHTFCVPEDYNPNSGSGGIGLCNEFGIEKSIGYAEAKPGECFPKLGIGLLTRPDDAAYNFFRPYEIAHPFPILVESGPAQACFVVDPIDCRGYAARETKTVSVEGNCLQISYQLENVGSQPLITHEYCHNFVGIDRQPVGPDYTLRFPYPVTFDKNLDMFRGMLPPLLRKITPGFIVEMLAKRMVSQDVLDVRGSEIHWKATPTRPFYRRPLGFHPTGQPQWELALASSGVGMREIDDFSPARVALWGVAHVVSAEIFVDIHLLPGQSQTWTRKYEFFA